MAYLFFSAVGFRRDVAEYVSNVVGLASPPPPPVPLVVHGSGGTTWDVVSFVEKYGVRGVVLVGFGEYNSFASVLHARAELEARGVPVVVYHCVSYRDCAGVLERARRVAEAASALYGVRVALVGSSPHVDAFEKLGWRVEVTSLEEFEKLVDAADADEEALRVTGDVVVAKVTSALGELGRGRDVVAIQCFPYLMKVRKTPCFAVALLNARGSVVACEGDLSAAFAMLLSKKLTGYSGWVANVVYKSGAEAVFAHCTISLNMAKRWSLMPHFESGHPVSVAGELAHTTYTIVAVSPRLDKIAVGRAEVEKSGNYLRDACRTQAFVKLQSDLVEKAPANHHVFIPGDHVEEVENIAKLLSIKVVKY